MVLALVFVFLFSPHYNATPRLVPAAMMAPSEARMAPRQLLPSTLFPGFR